MEVWVAITIAAAFVQNIRSSLQKHLKGAMGTTGATFVRFGFGLPFVWLFLAYLVFVQSVELPSISSSFALWVIVGSLAQIFAQLLLLHLFSLQNFTVGSAYSRTEPIQAALFGLAFLGDNINAQTLLAIFISLLGVMLISLSGRPMTFRNLVLATFTKPTGIGLASGAFFGLASVSYRGASLSLGGPDFITQGTITLASAISLQTIILLSWITLREPDTFKEIRQALPLSFATGFVGALASLGWFTAMTLQSAALVKAVAQIEMIFTYLSSVLIFREHINRYEILGCVLIVTGILIILVI